LKKNWSSMALWRIIMNSKKHIGKWAIFMFLALLIVSVKAMADPEIPWNTFLGSANSEENNAVAVDGSGNVYVAGLSNSTWGTPVNPHSGGYNVFAAKLDSNGNLLWNTFLGTTNNEWGSGIVVDGSGNVYVAGLSNSTWGTPVNPHSGGDDVFVAKLDSSGNILWNTFLGSMNSEENSAIEIDGSGNIYVTGLTLGSWGKPISLYSGGADAFAAKLDNNGNLLWNTFLGSTDYDEGSSIAVDISGNVYVAGLSNSPWGMPLNPSWSGDAFAAKLDSDGNLLWSTFLGTDNAESEDIGVDSDGNIYVAGGDNATWGTPVNPYSGGWDAFAAKLDNDGNLLWYTFLGSEQDDWGSTAVDVDGNVYVGGGSCAAWGMPVNPYSGGEDAFVAKLDTGGNLLCNTFIGSTNSDYSNAIAVDGSRNIYLSGLSNSTWGTPVNPYSGGEDVFVAKLVPITKEDIDMDVFAADYGRMDCTNDCGGDFNTDRDVDGSDLSVFAMYYGRMDCLISD
jgi:hypothetical protein